MGEGGGGGGKKEERYEIDRKNTNSHNRTYKYSWPLRGISDLC